MRATVTANYTDRLDGTVHLAGEDVDLTEARARELAGAGFVRLPERKRTTRGARAPRE